MTQYGPLNRPVRALTAAGLCLALLGALVYQSFGPFDWLGAPEVAAVGGYDAVDEVGQTDEFTAGDPAQSVADYDHSTIDSGEALNAFQMHSPRGIGVFFAADDPPLAFAVAYIADSGNNRVLGFDLDASCGDGCELNGFGSEYARIVLGQPDFRSNDADVSAEAMDNPVGVVVGDADANYVFVADSNNNRVLAFELDGEGSVVDATADIVLGQSDFDSNLSGTSSVSMSSPYHLALDVAGDRLFVVDSGNNRVLVFDLAGGISNGMPAVNVIGQPDFTSSAPALSATGLDDPRGVAFSGGESPFFSMLLVADRNNNRVLAYDVRQVTDAPEDFCGNGNGTDGIEDGMTASCVLGQTDFTTGTGGFSATQFSQPAALGISYHAVSVGSYTDNRILTFDIGALSDGAAAVNVIGDDDFAPGGAPCDPNNLVPCQASVGVVDGIADVQSGNDGNLDIFVSDSDPDVRRVLHFTTPFITSNPSADEALGQIDGTIDPSHMLNSIGTISAWGLNNPKYLALDVSNDFLYVTDSGNHRVLGYDMDGLNVILDRGADTAIGQGTAVYSMFGLLSYDASEGDDAYEGVFRSGTNNWAWEESFEAGPGESEGDPNTHNMSNPTGIVFANDTGNLFVRDTNNDRLQRFPPTQFSGQDLDAEHALGINAESEIAYDGDTGRIFMPDGEASEITVYDNDFTVLGFLASPLSGDAVGVAYDAANSRLFASSGNCVYVYDGEGPMTGEGPIAVLGDENIDCSTGGGTDSARMSNPQGLAVDSVGERLFVADQGNNRILQFDIADVVDVGDLEEAVDVYGQDDLDSGGSGTTQSSLANPTDVLYLPTADQIVATDTGNNRIMFFEAQANPGGGGGGDPTGGHEATDVLGQLHGDDTITFDYNGVNNSPNSRGFSGPGGVVIDAVHHRLFAVDQGNHRVMVFDLDVNNQLIDRLADHLLGQPNFRANGNGTSISQLTYPQYVAYDVAGDRLFVSDYSNNRVMVFDVATIVDGENAINVLGQPDFDTNVVVLSDTGMTNPRGVAFNPTGNRLFVASQDHQRVLVYDVTTITNGEAAVNVLGQEDFTTAGPNLDQDGFGTANNVLVDALNQRLFVEDSPFHRVMVFDISTIDNGEDAVNVIGQDDFTSGGSGLDQDLLDFSGIYGNGLAYDTDVAGDRLFVADGSNRRVVVFNVNPSVLIANTPATDGPDAINVLGQIDFTSEDDSLSQSSTRAAAGLAYDEDNGLLYTTTVGDTGQPDPDNRSSIFDVNVIVNGEPAVNLLGQLDENDEPYYTARGVDNSPNAQGMNASPGVALDPLRHRLFVSDWANSRVLVFDLDDSNQPLDHTADFVLGQPDFKTNTAATDDSTLDQPLLLSYDAEDDLLFVADNGNGRVMVWDTDVIINGEPAVYVIGKPDFDTSGGGTSISELSCPQGVSIEPLNGLLAVGDTCNNRALIYDLGGPGLPSLASGMDAAKVFGEPDFDTNVCDTGSSGMCHPVGVLAERNTNSLWVADVDNNRVLRFDLFGASSDPALNVLGQDDFLSNGADTSQSGFDQPHGVAIIERDDNTQRLFVGDYNNSRVMVFDTSDGIDDGEDAVDAYGQETFSTADCETSITGLCGLKGVDYDESSDTLYVGDDGNHRILIFGPEPSGGGGSNNPPTPVGFTPGRIIVNEDDGTTNSRNVLVSVYAQTTGNFVGTVDVLLSNTTSFETFVPFRYVIPERLPNGNNTRDIWPKTIAWDLCFGITDTTECKLGIHTVYARFYVNVPAPSPVLVRPTNQ